MTWSGRKQDFCPKVSVNGVRINAWTTRSMPSANRCESVFSGMFFGVSFDPEKSEDVVLNCYNGSCPL